MLLLTGSICFVEMFSNFAQCREVARLAQEVALKYIEPNPARAVERASLVAVPASFEDTTTTPSANIPAE